MRILLAATLLLSTAAAAQDIQPGKWEVRSTAIDLTIPGTPAFMLRMAKGKTRTEQKCVAPAQARRGMAALLIPDPKAKCQVESQQVAAGRYAQALTCPQRDGRPMRVTRTGSYDAASFTGRLVMAGDTKKGAMNVVVDQAGRRTEGGCKN